MPAIALLGVWQGCGYFMVIFLAALSDIPQDFYDAASIDGANAWQMFSQVVVPMDSVKPLDKRRGWSAAQVSEHNRERLHRPDRIRVRHILLAAPPADVEARASARATGERLIAELGEHPERFTEFAQRYSACPSKDQGGELGWVERGDTTPEFERQLFMLEPGLAKLTVETRYGHHVTWIDAIERGDPLSYEEAAPRIAAYLETQARQNAIHQYLQLLQQRYPVRGLDELASSR